MQKIEYRKRIDSAEGFLVEIEYKETAPILFASGYGGSGCSLDDWKFQIPVYKGDWQTAEEKAIRRYGWHICALERQKEIKNLLEKKADNLLVKLINHLSGWERECLFRAVGLEDEAKLQAEEEVLKALTLFPNWRDGERVQKISSSFAVPLPQEWREDWFDDLVIQFVEKGLNAAKSEEIIKKLVALNASATKEFLPEFVLAYSRAGTGSRYGTTEQNFIFFLEKLNLFSSEHRHIWAKRALKGYMSEWLDVEAQNPCSKCSKEEKKMEEWIDCENISREEIQEIAVGLLRGGCGPASSIEILTKAFDLDQNLAEEKIIEFLSKNIDKKFYDKYPQYAERALELAKENFRNGTLDCDNRNYLLADWVPLPFEDKKAEAKILVEKNLQGNDPMRVGDCLYWNEKFQLHIPELDRLRDILKEADTRNLLRH